MIDRDDRTGSIFDLTPKERFKMMKEVQAARQSRGSSMHSQSDRYLIYAA